MNKRSRASKAKACGLLGVVLAAGLLGTAVGCDRKGRSGRSNRPKQAQKRQPDVQRPANPAAPLPRASGPIRKAEVAERPAPAAPARTDRAPLGQSNPALPGVSKLKAGSVKPAATKAESASEPVKIDRVTLEVLKELHRAWGCDEPPSASPAGKS